MLTLPNGEKLTKAHPRAFHLCLKKAGWLVKRGYSNGMDEWELANTLFSI